MIYDYGTQVTCTAPGDGVGMTVSTDSIDLTAGGDGVPALIGHGERLYMQFEVTTAFGAPEGTPRLLFGPVISATQTIGVEGHILGLTGGSIAGTLAAGTCGYDESELTLGRTFHMPIPSWEDVMEEDAAKWPHAHTTVTLANFRLLKWLGIVIYNPLVSASHFFAEGAVSARIVKDPTTANKSNLYASRMGVK